jgi:hypothetical protein
MGATRMKRCVAKSYGERVETDFEVEADLTYPVYDERIVLRIDGNDNVAMSVQEARRVALALLTAAEHTEIG